MVVRRKGGDSQGLDGDEFACTRFGLTPPSPPSARAQIARRQARNYAYGDDGDSRPTHSQSRSHRQDQRTKQSPSTGRSRIRQRSEMSTTTAISYASDDEHDFLDDLSSCGTVSETGRRPRSVTSTPECHNDAQQPTVSGLDASYNLGEIFRLDDGNDDTRVHPSKNTLDGPGKRPRVSFYTAIYDTSRGESRAEGTGVRVLQQSDNKPDIISGGGPQQSCSPPVSQVSVPTADATTVASSHVSDEEHSPRSPKSWIRDVVGRITRTSLTFFGDSEDGIDIGSEEDDELFCDNDYEATFSRPGSESVERSSVIKRPRLPSSLHRIEGDLRRHKTPLGLVRIVPARESSLRCILTRNGSGGSMSPRAQLAPSSSSQRGRSNILGAFSIRFSSLLVTMGCILLVASAFVATSTTDVSLPSPTILLGAQNLPPSSLASTYLSLVMNEVRYQAFGVASVQCRDLNAIRHDLLGASHRLQNRRLLLDPDEAKEEERVKDDIMIEKLRREASFVSRQRVEERFGRGPHYVRIHAEVGGNQENDEATTEFFVVKMADVSLMPISVSSFLGQVQHGFWNDKEFDINAGHILLASGGDADADDKDAANLDELTNLGIASPIYGEYNPLRPHSELTLGFVANRPTPHFYINLRDNEEVHGWLSDQDHHFVDGEADPSFADIIDGKDVVSRVVEQVPFYEVNGQKKTVKIVRAEIDSAYTPPSLR